MRRREVITLLGGVAAAWPFAALAQQPAVPLVGIINAGSAAATADGYEAFRSRLRQLGYVEGRNIRYEYRFADGFLDRLPRLAEELVRLNPAIIVSAPVPARKRNKAVLCLAHVTNTMGLADRDFEKGEADGTADALMILEALAKALHPTAAN